jgi:hypothetical protein
MERYVASGLEVPDLLDGEVSRCDLIFYEVDHSGESYEARVFINNPDASLSTPRDLASGYAGAFTVFGHGGCYGDVGHCDVPSGPREPFDRRPPHPLTPWTKTVIITPALARLGAHSTVDVTVIAVKPGEDSEESCDAMRFSRVRLATYAS